ncbi:MAG: DUF1648 domain-containing protein [Clostridia bacterium]|nr:DUF1648 domain-containing protein [Clostridia bacterium]
MRRTYFDWFLVTLTALVFVGGLVYLLYYWDSIPAMIPIHFGLNGEIDGFDDKYKIYSVVVLEAILVGVTVATAFMPKFWNIPLKDGQLVRSAVKVMLEVMALVFALYFTGMYMIIAQAAVVPAWFFESFVLIIIGLSFSPFIFAVIARLKK